jgi:hypothetical protein
MLTLWLRQSLCGCEEVDGPAVSALRRAIAEVKQRWLVIGWVTKNLLSRAPNVVPAAFAVVKTHQFATRPLWVMARSPYV